MTTFEQTLIMVNAHDLVTLDEAIDLVYQYMDRTGDDSADDVAYDLKNFRSRIETALGA